MALPLFGDRILFSADFYSHHPPKGARFCSMVPNPGHADRAFSAGLVLSENPGTIASRSRHGTGGRGAGKLHVCFCISGGNFMATFRGKRIKWKAGLYVPCGAGSIAEHRAFRKENGTAG